MAHAKKKTTTAKKTTKKNPSECPATRAFDGKRFKRARKTYYPTKAKAETAKAKHAKTNLTRLTGGTGTYMVWVGRKKKTTAKRKK